MHSLISCLGSFFNVLNFLVSQARERHCSIELEIERKKEELLRNQRALKSAETLQVQLPLVWFTLLQIMG